MIQAPSGPSFTWQSREGVRRLPLSCFSTLMAGSDDSVVPQGLEQHCVLDVAEHPADVVGVRGAGKVWVQGLPLPALVPGDGLLLVQLADVFLGVLGVSPFTCRGGERQAEVSGRGGIALLLGGGRKKTRDLFRALGPGPIAASG